jgi:hypothetical protein
MMIELNFHTLRCIEDAEDGKGEPYLWAAVIRVDSTRMQQGPNPLFLTGSPEFLFNKGSQGNLGPGISSGQHRSITSTTGRFVTDLQPMTLSLLGKTETFGGFVGYVAVLLEENMVPAAAMEAAHHAFNTVMRDQLTGILTSVNLFTEVWAPATAAIDAAAMKGETLSFEDALLGVVMALLGDRLKAVYKVALAEVVRVALENGASDPAILQTALSTIFLGAPGLAFAAAFDEDDVINYNYGAILGDALSGGAVEYRTLYFRPGGVPDPNDVGASGGVGTKRLPIYEIDVSIAGNAPIDRWQSLGGELTEAPGVASTVENRLDVFARATNNALYRRKWTGKTWTDWEELGGRIASAPAAVSWGAGRLDVFMRGEDNRLWQWWSDGQQNGWQQLDGELTSAPAVASQEQGSLDVFARATDMTLYRKKWRRGSWGEWTPVPDSIRLTSDPAAVAWGKGRLDVFMRGEDMALWQWWTNGQQSGWQRLGGELTSGPAAASRKVNRLDVFARGTDNAIYHILWGGTSWSQWETLGGSAASSPAAVSWGPNRLDLFVRGSDNSLRQRWWDGMWRP